MSIDVIVLSALGMATASFTLIQMGKAFTQAEVEKAREKSVGAKAIADALERITRNERRLEDHGKRLTAVEAATIKLEKEYLDVLKDIINHYVKR